MINYAIYKTTIGNIKLSYKENNIVGIDIIKDNIPNYGEKTTLTDTVHKQLEEYFSGNRFFFDFPFKLEGTDFQLKVWNELCNIPYGHTRTYKEIAKLIGNEKASRAVGNANNKNPIGIVVPCHRVIGSNGKLVGYAGGLDIKEKLLDLEKIHTNK